MTSHQKEPLIAAALVAAMVLLVGGRLLFATSDPILDQEYLLRFTFSEFVYPTFQSGLFIRLIVGFLHLFLPYEIDSTHLFLRVITASFYLIAGGLLGYTITRGMRHRLAIFALFMALLLTSRYVFLWLSTELLVGAMVMLVFWSLLEKHPFWVTGLLMGLLALAKPDVLLPTLIMAAYLAIVQRRFREVAIGVGLVALVAAPSVFADTSYEDVRYPGSRDLFSFCQHYADVTFQMQRLNTDLPDPMQQCDSYLRNSFGEVESVPEAIIANPRAYMNFLFLSLSHSLRKMLRSYLLLLLIPLAVTARYYPFRQIQIAGLLLFLSNFGIVLALSYFHVRYQARFYPLALMFVVASLGYIDNKKLWWGVIGYLGLLLLVQTGLFIPTFELGNFHPD